MFEPTPRTVFRPLFLLLSTPCSLRLLTPDKRLVVVVLMLEVVFLLLCVKLTSILRLLVRVTSPLRVLA